MPYWLFLAFLPARSLGSLRSSIVFPMLFRCAAAMCQAFVPMIFACIIHWLRPFYALYGRMLPPWLPIAVDFAVWRKPLTLALIFRSSQTGWTLSRIKSLIEIGHI